MKIKLTFWRGVFIVIMCLGLYSSFIRYFRGLGAVSNMTDQFPWGLWIGFDCLCGVMLAAGAFVVTGVVYLLDIERLHPIARPAVLTAACDLFVAIVSSLVVWPAAGFPVMAKRNGAALIIINREPTDFDRMADLVVRDDIGDVLEPFLAG